MLEMRQLFDPESSTYTYLLWDPKTHEAALIDSVEGQHERDMRLVEELGLRLRLALETHIHADHITGAGRLREATGCEIAIHRNSGADCADRLLDDGDRIELGGSQILVIFTPGHTDCDVSYLVDDRVFCGDVLLIRGSGRTDFQSGDAERSYESVTKRLFALPDSTRVYPAHDYNGIIHTTIGEERRHNPRLGCGKSRRDYLRIMGEMDDDPPKMLDIAVPANQACGLGGRA